jgi:hypothetical protein
MKRQSIKTTFQFCALSSALIFVTMAGSLSLAGKPADARNNKEKVTDKDDKPQEPSQEELIYLDYVKKLQESLKAIKTPFTSTAEEKTKESNSLTGPLTLGSRSSKSRLGQRVSAPQLYLPGRLILGQKAQFTIKGKPGLWVALAMADRDCGAKAVYGLNVRLGPDRKVVALGQIPESGVLQLSAYTPVAGDLIGQNLYFEAAVWPEEKLLQTEIARTVQAESQNGSSTGNGILVLGNSEKKHGLKIVPDSLMPPSARNNQSGLTLDSGKP